ncbi:PilN family type IVB pilus formation outer membrane protein [Tatumella sp. JGM118]|uniref:PilN family type IVB pilus formation outer membrane protein n=1 Tax=Tatumella sp. JGM118 TaxID=2799796 RepID=UPI001BAED09F|nr:PilN family type IVB pilus formation outer membrane protein [Tatumella sp. JGM118]MBS0907943.1 PilN family type IVB pilus formation outer membrane protein [Tatumella sp. JGM118]
MKFNKKTTLSLLSLLFIQLSGCSSWQRINEIEKENNQLTSQADAMMPFNKAHPYVVNENSQWINPEPVSHSSQDGHGELPFCNMTLNHPGNISLQAIASLITSQCQIPVNVTQDALSQQENSSGFSDQDPSMNDPLPGNGAPVNSVSSGASLNHLFWQGPVSGLLDDITARQGLSWEYQDHRVIISYMTTKTFPVLFMDNNASFYSRTVSGTTSSQNQNTNGVAGGQNASDNGDKNSGTTSQATTMEIKSGLYHDISSTISMMLTPGKGRMDLTNGELTVRDTPRVLSEVARYIDDRNTQLNRQVVLNVQVYSIDNKDNDQLGIDWKAVFNNTNLGLSLTSPYADAASEMMSSGISILDGKGQGSTALVKALAEQTHLTVVTQLSSMTTNLSAVPVQVALQQDYASDTSTENTANVGSSSSISKSTITTGLNMTILPYLMPDSTRMQLQFAINMSDDPTFRTFTSQNASIELMKTRMKIFTQRVLMKSGQTLVLSGYQSVSNSDDHQGVDHSHFFLFGGGDGGSRGKSALVILITPVLMG